MLVFGVSVFLNCVIERTPSLQWLTGWGFRLNMLYSEVSPNVCLCEVHLVRAASASVCAQRDFGLNVHGIQADGTNPAVGSLGIDSLPQAPTISIDEASSSITLNELKDGSAGSSTSTTTLSLDFDNIITINDSGGTVLLSYRILDDDAVYEGLANE